MYVIALANNSSLYGTVLAVVSERQLLGSSASGVTAVHSMVHYYLLFFVCELYIYIAEFIRTLLCSANLKLSDEAARGLPRESGAHRKNQISVYLITSVLCPSNARQCATMAMATTNPSQSIQDRYSSCIVAFEKLTKGVEN